MNKTILFILFVVVFIVFSSGIDFAAASEHIVETSSVSSFSGSWREIGRQIALTYPEYVFDFGIAMNTALFFAGPGQGWSPEIYYNSIKDNIPKSITDHMEGLAEGLSEALFMSYDTAWHIVLTQNLATELLNMKRVYSEMPSLWERGCTGFAVSSDAGLFLCHNTDAPGGGMDNIVVIMHWRPDNGDYSYITMDPPGWADVSYGINENKIAAVLNAGFPNIGGEVGLPVSFMIRHAMGNASTLEQAISFFTDYLADGNSFGTSGSIVIFADFNTSTIAKLQIRSREIKINYGNDLPNGSRFLAAANHFTDGFNPDPEYYYESSFKRYERLLELINNTWTFDLEACWDILSDTNDGQEDDNTISRVANNSYTMFGLIFSEDAIYYTMGPPSLYRKHFGEPVEIAYTGIENSPVTSFTLHPYSWRVFLNWEVGDNADVMGFNIYRADSQQGIYTKINESLIMPSINHYEDTLLINRNRYYYRLESEYSDGSKTSHGPVCTTPRLIYLFLKPLPE